MNGRQQLIEQIRQQSIEKRAQALREAAQRQFSNAPIAGASSSGGGGRKTQCLPLGGVMLSFIDPNTEAYVRYFLTESGTLNGQPQYLVLVSSEGNGQFFVRINWTGSEWVLGQVFAIDGTIDVEQDFAFSPTLLSSAWPNGQDIEYVTSPGEEFDCSWRHCFAVSGDLFAATYSLAATWLDIPLTEAPNAYTSGGEGFNIFWDEKSLGWIIEGPDEGDLSILPGGTREQLPIGQFAIFDDLVLAISSSVCTFAPPLPPPPPVPGFIFRVDTTLGDGDSSFEIPTSGSYSYDYTATWTLVSDPSVTDTNSGFSGNCNIIFPAGGQYDIEITGLFPAMEGGGLGDQPKVIGIIQWGSNQWQSMSSMFFACSNLSLYLATDQPDLGEVTSMQGMFDSASLFNGDISGWDVSNVTDMSQMFAYANSFNADISGWDVSGVTSMIAMFYDATSFNADISGWNTSGVTDMNQMFTGATTFNADISLWDVSNVTNMGQMFSGATSFNYDISLWDVSNVTDMSSMFENASAFNQGIGDWDVSGVIDMRSMFQDATSFNGDISLWDVSQVTDMSSMFQNAGAFNADLSSWIVSGVTDMAAMFGGATTFNADISLWDVSQVTDMKFMFGATTFNPDISLWNVSQVTDMSSMFSNATSFNADISGWDVSGVNGMNFMFENAPTFNMDLSGWCVSGISPQPPGFDAGATAWVLPRPNWGSPCPP
jgi:surface protein